MNTVYGKSAYYSDDGRRQQQRQQKLKPVYCYTLKNVPQFILSIGKM